MQTQRELNDVIGQLDMANDRIDEIEGQTTSNVCISLHYIALIFTARRHASAVLAVVVCPFVCPPVLYENG